MTELFKSFRDTQVFGGIYPVKGNLGIGFFRSEKVTLVDSTIVPLRGPPIAVYHPPEYDTASYRCDNGSQTMKHGVVGIYNIKQDLWVTSDISKVKPSRTTIILSGDNTVAGEELMIYYYADSPGIGAGMSNLQGDQVTPESIDILIKALNDAHSMIYTEYGATGDDSPEFRFGADAGFHTLSAHTFTTGATTWHTLLDYPGTGTFRWSDFPVQMTELAIKFAYDSWSYLDFRITIDGSVVTNGFGTPATNTMDYIRWMSLDTGDFPSGSSYDRHPGRMMGASSEPLFFDIYADTDSPHNNVIRLGLVCEIISDIKVEVRVPVEHTDTMSTYIRGYYIP